MRDLPSLQPFRRILPIAHQALASVIDLQEFKERCSKYFHEECEEISMNVCFVLLQVKFVE